MKTAIGRPCVRCIQPTPATRRINVCVEEERYPFDLCNAHADRLSSDLAMWTNLVDTVVEHNAPIRFGEPGRRRPQKVPVTFPIRRVDAPDETVEPPVPIRTSAAPTVLFSEARQLPPDAQLWTIGRHAHDQGKLPDRRITDREMLWAAVRPDFSFPDKDEPDVFEHRRGDICVVVNARTKHVITCYRLSASGIEATTTEGRN